MKKKELRQQLLKYRSNLMGLTTLSGSQVNVSQECLFFALLAADRRLLVQQGPFLTLHLLCLLSFGLVLICVCSSMRVWLGVYINQSGDRCYLLRLCHAHDQDWFSGTRRFQVSRGQDCAMEGLSGQQVASPC